MTFDRNPDIRNMQLCLHTFQTKSISQVNQVFALNLPTKISQTDQSKSNLNSNPHTDKF